MYTHPFFEATPPGAAPGPPVSTGARVRHFRGCNKPRAGPNFLIFVFDPKNAVECPLETSAKDDLARRLSPHNFVPIENLTFTSP